MSNIVQTRFAPSPTGDLHLGGARTALYNWLYAKQQGGQFILRIEDTDQERSSQHWTDRILEAIKWLGFDHEGVVYYQSKRLERYRFLIQQLCDSGAAYRCYCNPERLEALRQKQLRNRDMIGYDGHCRNRRQTHPSQLPYVVRLKTPSEGETCFQDQVLGPIVVQNQQLDDFIIARRNGIPTYHLSVVVDDIDMNITHVIRGNDHVSNTPKQIHIFRALHGTIPQYSHLPMVLGSDGKRLSKRHGALSVLTYREAGFLPEALCNYLLRLGWSHGDQELWTRETMLRHFDLKHLHTSAAQFQEKKLLWLNQYTMKHTAYDDLVALLLPMFVQRSIDTQDGPPLYEIVKLMHPRSKTLQDLFKVSTYFYQDQVDYNLQAIKKYIDSATWRLLQLILDALTTLETWTPDAIAQVLHTIALDQTISFPQLAQPLRIVLTGDTASPSIDQTVYYTGKERVLKRFTLFFKRYA